MKSHYVATASHHLPTQAVRNALDFVADALKSKKLPKGAQLVSTRMTHGTYGFWRRPIWNFVMVYSYDLEDLNKE